MNKKVLLIIAAMMVIAGNTRAAEPEWFGSLDANGLGQSTEWFDANMWRNPSAVPTISDKAKINLVWGNPGPVIDADPAIAADVNQLYVAESNGALPGAQTLEVTTGGVLGVDAEAVLGYGRDDVNDVNDDGKLLVTGGTVNCNQHLFVGYNPGAIGRLQIDSGTVDVNQMFGLSWNGGDGYAQLNGGTLITEEFTFENVAGGTASMDITGGKWVQKHFWWNKIRALVYAGKITGYADSGGDRSNVVVTWDDVNERTIVTATNDPNYIVTVKQDGTGDHTTIQGALNDPCLAWFDVIEVQDDATYNGNGTGRLVFPADVNYLTLQARDGNNPTITLFDPAPLDPNIHYIHMRASGQTIQGFDINFSGACDNTTDSNSAMILAHGSFAAVRDCNIVGPTFGWIRGISGVATIEDTEITHCRQAIVCDINEPNFLHSISGCHIRDTHFRGINFLDCNAVMDDCLVERCGGSLTPGEVGGNVRVADGNDKDPDGTTNVLITNSILREALYGRNLNMETIGTATIEDSIIMNALGTATHSDEIIQYRGTLNLNRCILKSGQRACVNMTAPSSGQQGSICNIDHCDLMDTNETDQWGAFTADPCAVLTVTNSILTGEYGLLANNENTIDSNWNDVYCDTQNYGLYAEAGANDISVEPYYIQTDDPDLDTFFALQPYSPVVNADEDGNYMGSQGVLYGYEVWPGDFRPPQGVDFNDFAVLALHWQDSNIIPAIPQLVLDTFEEYTATGGPGQVGTLLGPREVGVPDSWRVLDWGYTTVPPDPLWWRGSSTLSLLTDPCDANTGSKAMRWEYDVNVPPNDTNAVRYTEILVVLPNEVNFAPYDRLTLSLNRHSGNSPDNETFMYAKFLNDIYGTYGKGGGDLTGPDYRDVANSVVGGHTLSSHPDEYDNWSINLDRLENWTWGHKNLYHVGAIIFAVRTQPERPYGHGTGTIDVDDIRLIDEPGCSGNPEGDLNKDCEVTIEDVKIFTDVWLGGK